MAQYKVPQDVEADDKLLGPFTFRQFIYLIILAGFIALAFLLFQAFPLLAVIPLPVIILFGALALPIKKDQPMETYLAAVVSYFLKPRKRFWIAGLPESTIRITAPKKVEKERVRNISEEEAGRRLSFLADIVDTEGYAIKGAASTSVREEIYAEAEAVNDMFSSPASGNIDKIITDESATHHAELVEQMKRAIEGLENIDSPGNTPTISHGFSPSSATPPSSPTAAVELMSSPVVVQPLSPEQTQATSTPSIADATISNMQASAVPAPAPEVSQDIIDLANNPDLSVETIAKEAHRLQQKHDDEVYISLH